jgi:hypothetical protein
MILACETRGVCLVLVWFENQKSLGLLLFDVPDVAVSRASTALKFKNSVLSECGSLQGFREYDSGLLVCTVFSNRRVE